MTQDHSRRRWRIATMVWTAIAVAALAAAAGLVIVDAIDHDWPVHLGDVVKGWDTAVLDPAYWIFVALILVAEWRWPARRGEGSWSTGGAVDFVWLLLFPIFSLTVVALYVSGLDWLWEHPLRGWELDVAGALGVTVTAVLAFLVADLGMWCSHWVRHSVPTFWRFHQVHHSQQQMGVLTDNRVHFVEAIVSATIVYIPVRLLGLSDQAAAALAFATVFFTGFTHANLRTNLGPLRWVLVTPQSHRVHHSAEDDHFDHNFGAILSVWDRLFRTQWPEATVYPATGIGPSDFPVETGSSPASAFRLYGRQLVYPFRRRKPAA